jgi:putative transposase
MTQSLAQIYLHIVFSTKDSEFFLFDRDLRERLFKYLAGACKKQDCPAIMIGGDADHVHIACCLGRGIDVSTLIRELKRESSKWIKQQDPMLSPFQWQRGYGAFSVSPSHLDRLIVYIRNQEEHHRQETYQEEFCRLCEIYGLKLDDRYAWD